MPLFQGVNAVDSVFNGTTEVERIYQGANLLFQSAAFSQPAPAVSGYLSAWNSIGTPPSSVLAVVTNFLQWQSTINAPTQYEASATVETGTNYELSFDSDSGLVSQDMFVRAGGATGGFELVSSVITFAIWEAGGTHTFAFNSGANTTIFFSLRRGTANAGLIRFNNTFLREA